MATWATAPSPSCGGDDERDRKRQQARPRADAAQRPLLGGAEPAQAAAAEVPRLRQDPPLPAADVPGLPFDGGGVGRGQRPRHGAQLDHHAPRLPSRRARGPTLYPRHRGPRGRRAHERAAARGARGGAAHRPARARRLRDGEGRRHPALSGPGRAGMKVDIDSLRAHIGRKIEETDEATAPPMRGMTVTFERPEPAPVRGEPELSDIQLREGGTGTMIFTTVTRRIYTPRGLAVTEDQHTVFREAVDPLAPVRTSERAPAPTDVTWRRTITPDPVSLFRYSALTFNPHRIHYDRTYTMQEEGYPGLVVHGPFSQQCLLDLLRDNAGGKAIRSFTMRARAPLFDTAPFTVIGRPRAEGAEVWAVGPDGGIAMQATATLG